MNCSCRAIARFAKEFVATTEVEGVAAMQGNLTNEIVGKLGVRNLSKGVKIELMEGKVHAELSVSKTFLYLPESFSDQFLFLLGRLSNCKSHPWVHIYFTLKDGTGQLSCVMFAGQRVGLAFRMSEGQNVVVSGSVKVYERDGKYHPVPAPGITQAGYTDFFLRQCCRHPAKLHLWTR